MRHGVKKIKFSRGVDFNRNLIRQLTISFLKKGAVKTSFPKAKTLKRVLDSLLSKTQNKTPATTRVLYKALGASEMVKAALNLGKSLGKRTGGYVRIVKLENRAGDGAAMARLELLSIPEYMTAKEEVKKPGELSKKEEKSPVKTTKKI